MAQRRFSRQREQIYRAVYGRRDHPTAEMVYQRLKPELPRLSMGTVYRNLIFFQEHGDIQSVGVVQGQERFDGVVTPHSHFVCNRCGLVLDLPGIQPDGDMDRTVSQQYGLAVQRHELTFYGLCPDCMRQGPHQHHREEPSS